MRTLDHFMRYGSAALLALGAATAQAQQPAAPAASAPPSIPPSAPPSVPPSAERAELEQLRATTLALIQALVDQGLIARERADALLKQAAAKAAPAPAAAAVPPGQWGAPPATVRVPYIPETLKAQIKEDIRNDVLATAREEGWADSRRIPPWVRGLTIEGDVRVRAQGELFADDNLAAEVYRDQTDSPAWSPDLTNTLAARKRLTLRARLGVLAKVSEDVSAGLRIVAAGTTGPSSASSTLGTNFNRLNASIDRAWLRWEPRFNLRMEAGRTASPYYGTDLLWPDDLSMDGASVRAEHDLAPGVFAFGVLGAFQLEEFALSKSDKWLYGAQVGADWSLTDKVQMRASLALYDFQNVEGVRENEVPPTGPRAGTVPYQTSQYAATLRQKGNTLINLNDPTSTASPVWGLASRFRPINLTTAFTFSHFQPYLTGLTFDVREEHRLRSGRHSPPRRHRRGGHAARQDHRPAAAWPCRHRAAGRAGRLAGLRRAAQVRARRLGRCLHRHHLAPGRHQLQGLQRRRPVRHGPQHHLRPALDKHPQPGRRRALPGRAGRPDLAVGQPEQRAAEDRRDPARSADPFLNEHTMTQRLINARWRGTWLAMLGLGLSLTLWAAGPAVAQDDKRASREREALRRAQQALRSAQEQQATLLREKEALSADKARLDEEGKRAQAALGAARAQAGRARTEQTKLEAEREQLRAELDTLRGTLAARDQALAAAQSRQDELGRALQDAQRIGAERTQTARNVTTLLERATARLADAEGRNRQLYDVGLKMLEELRARGGGTGFIGFDAVRLENHAEALRSELEAHRLVGGPVAR